MRAYLRSSDADAPSSNAALDDEDAATLVVANDVRGTRRWRRTPAH
jgi:hypothetical protein